MKGVIRTSLRPVGAFLHLFIYLFNYLNGCLACRGSKKNLGAGYVNDIFSIVYPLTSAWYHWWTCAIKNMARINKKEVQKGKEWTIRNKYLHPLQAPHCHCIIGRMRSLHPLLQSSSCIVQLSGCAAYERPNRIGQINTPQNQNRL